MVPLVKRTSGKGEERERLRASYSLSG